VLGAVLGGYDRTCGDGPDPSTKPDLYAPLLKVSTEALQHPGVPSGNVAEHLLLQTGAAGCVEPLNHRPHERSGGVPVPVTEL